MIDTTLSIKDICTLALKHRLYVPGWSMHDFYTDFLEGESSCIKHATMYFVDGVPVGVAFVQRNLSMQCFVRKSMRRQQIGSKLVDFLREEVNSEDRWRLDAGIGVKAYSGKFWKSNNIALVF